MIAVSRTPFLGALVICGLGMAISITGAPQNKIGVAKSPIVNLPEKAQFKAVSVRDTIYAFHYVDDDATPPAKLASGGAVYRYNPAADRWESCAPMPVKKASYAIVAFNGRIYVIGGFTAPNTPSASVEEYDPAADAWSVKKDMATPRSRTALLALDGKIYALGGKTREGVVTDAVEAFDPAANSWSERRNLTRPMMGVAAAVANGKIYKLKGTQLSGEKFEMVLEFEEYDPAADAWSKKAAWTWEREPLEFIAASGRLFAVGAGAYTGPEAHSLMEYVAASDRWVIRSEMPVASAHTIHPGWTVLDGRIYTFGGGYLEGKQWCASDRAQRYDPATDAWEELPPMSEGRIGMGVAAAGGAVYVVGGEKMGGSWAAAPDKYSSLAEAYRIRASAPGRQTRKAQYR